MHLCIIFGFVCTCLIVLKSNEAVSVHELLMEGGRTQHSNLRDPA